MESSDRRSFLHRSIWAGTGLSTLPHFLQERRAASSIGMSVARYTISPKEPDGIAEEAERLTRGAIEAIGGMSRIVRKGDTVWVKPNIGWDRRPEQAATTNPTVVAVVVQMCLEAGAGKVLVSDHSCNMAARAFPRSGIQQAAEKAGAHVFFMDERKYKKMAINGKVLKDWEVYTDVVEADKFINVPIAKHHGLCQVTLGMKNLMGAVGGPRNQYHQDLRNTLVDAAQFLKPDLIVLDAIRVLIANGPAGGNPADVRRMDTIAASIDQVAIDSFGATLLGHKPESIGHIAEAAARKLGTMNYASITKEMSL